MNTAPLKRLISAFDNISHSTGEAFSWAIIVLVFGISYEVIMRYLFNSPTSWAFDMSFILYGALFMMAGAYTLSKGEHVRGDFIYQRWNPTTQAKVDLILYLVFLSWNNSNDRFRIRIRKPVNVDIRSFSKQPG